MTQARMHTQPPVQVSTCRASAPSQSGEGEAEMVKLVVRSGGLEFLSPQKEDPGAHSPPNSPAGHLRPG